VFLLRVLGSRHKGEKSVIRRISHRVSTITSMCDSCHCCLVHETKYSRPRVKLRHC
jgi:hypothetical protein